MSAVTMGGLLSPSDRKQMVAVEKAVRSSHRSDAEIAMRDLMEDWCRARWPAARIFHELVMNQGTVRADMAAISPAHLVAFEIKGPWDGPDRLIHQIAMYRLAVPELWLVTAGRNSHVGALVRHLLPSVGLLEVRHENGQVIDDLDGYARIWGGGRYKGHVDRGALRVEVIAEAEPFAPLPESMLSLLWVAELREEAVRARVASGTKLTHGALVERMSTLEPAEQLAAVCRQLRGRSTAFRADPPITPRHDAGQGPE